MEFCAGSGNLSAAMREAGFTIYSIDHEHNRHQPKVALILQDLTDEHAQQTALDMVDQLNPLSIHLGLPCGTCSRARERQLPVHLRETHSAPPPLRSAQHLMGLPGLSNANSRKVEAANRLYHFACRLLFMCFTKSILVSVENPTRSWLWGILALLVSSYNHSAFTEWFAALSRVDFHACMHGSERNKATRLLSSPGLYDELAIQCSNDHPHKPWFVVSTGSKLEFATALEAEYPRLLCTRMAACLKNVADSRQLRLGPNLSSSQAARQAWGVQVAKSKPLIPEFKDFNYSDSQFSQAGYKLLATPHPGANQTELPTTSELASTEQSDQTKRPRRTFKYGVQWKPEEFFAKAKSVLHPKDPQKALPLVLKEALIHVMSSSPVEVAKHRLSVVLAIRNKAKELEDEERKLKDLMDPTTAHVLKDKRLCLWKYLLETTGFSDLQVFDLVSKGIPLYGSHTKPPNFPDDWKPSVISVDELLQSSVWRRKSLMSSRNSQLDEAVQADLYEATMKEVELGHLHGPFTESEVTAHFGVDEWLFNPRFALYQGAENKIRAIDDGKRSGLNLAYNTNFKLELYDVDTLAALSAAVAEAIQSKKLHLDMEDGTSCEVAVHSEVCNDTWVGRTLDLSRAYKQLAVDDASRRLAVVGFMYKGEWLFFRSDVLPFGAIAAVYSFNRVSRSLHHLICKLLWGPSTCFYDDYPTISPKASSAILSKAMSHLLTLLGWDHAKVGVKATDFAADFNALGISVQLGNLNKGAFILCNKEGRIDRLCAMLEKIAQSGSITKSEAAQIQGHLNFASGFYVSKALRFLSSSFARLADIPRALGSEDLASLSNLAVCMLRSIPPRSYAAESFKNPFLIFTDGAWESGKATGGAVTYDPVGDVATVFPVEIPEELVALWLEEVGEQLISQIEFFVYLVLRFVCSEALLNKLGIAWIDNESARFVAIKGSSSSYSLQSMSRVLQQIELEMPSSIWMERVSSFSNPSDMPSRNLVKEAAQLLKASSTGLLRAPQCLTSAIVLMHQQPYASLNALTKGVNSSA